MITQQNSAQQFLQPNNQMYTPTPQPQQLMRPQVIESKIDGVALVSSDEMITNYPVSGGATVALIDLGRNLLVFKTNDIYYGKGLYYETYDMKKREAPTPPIQNGNKTDNSDLMNQIQSDIASLKNEYNEIYKMLEELTAPTSKEAK